MDVKKLITIICVSVLIGLFGFIGVWFFMNFDTVKLAISGTQIYTQEDLDSAYQDGYDNALENKNDYDTLIGDYREQIASLTDEVSKLKYNLSITEDTISQNESEIDNLNSQLVDKQNVINELKNTNSANSDTISELELEIAYLSSQIETLDKETALLRKQKNDYLESINYYKNFLDGLETETSAFVTFIYNGQVEQISSIAKGTYASFTPPADTEYIQFNYWMVGETRVDDLSTYPIYTNTTFVANLNVSYDVKYYVGDNLYTSEIVLDGYPLPTIEEPTKAGYTFLGWSLDGVSVLDDEYYVVENDITLYAIFEALTWNVSYMDDTQIVHMEEVQTDNNPTGYTLTSTDRKVFKGWSLDGTNVIDDITTQVITGDTTYIAVYEYYYSVNYVVNGSIEKSILIKSGEYASSYTPIANSDYDFLGWTIDGSTIVDETTIQVTEDIELIAKLRFNNFDITFTNSEAEQLQVSDNGTIGFYSYKYYTDLSEYTISSSKQTFNIGLTLVIDSPTPTTITIDELGTSSFDYSMFSYNYYPNSSDTSTYYTFSIELYSGYVRFAVTFYNNTTLNDYDYTLTLNMNYEG